MSHSDTVGGQTLITGEQVLVTPEGVPVGSAFIGRRGSGGSGGRRRREEERRRIEEERRRIEEAKQKERIRQKALEEKRGVVTRTEGFQTLITGQEAIVDPFGTVLGIDVQTIGPEKRRFARLPEEKRAEARAILEARRTQLEIETADRIRKRDLEIRERDLDKPTSGRAITGTEEFISRIPTIGQLQRGIAEEDVQSQIQSFRALTPEQEEAAALAGRPGFGGMSLPGGGSEITFTPRQPDLISSAIAERRFRDLPSAIGEQASIFQRAAARGVESGEIRSRIIGSAALGISRGIAETAQLGIEAVSGGIIGAEVPVPRITQELRRQPTDPVQIVAEFAIPVGGAVGLGKRFFKTRRAAGTGRALEEAAESLTPVRIRRQTAFIPRGKLSETVTLGTPEREGVVDFTQIGRTSTGEIATISGGTIRRSPQIPITERIVRGEISELGTLVEVTPRSIETSPFITRPRTFRERLSLAPTEIPISRELGLSIPSTPEARGFIMGEFAGVQRSFGGRISRGLGGRRVSPIERFETIDEPFAPRADELSDILGGISRRGRDPFRGVTGKEFRERLFRPKRIAVPGVAEAGFIPEQRLIGIRISGEDLSRIRGGLGRRGKRPPRRADLDQELQQIQVTDPTLQLPAPTTSQITIARPTSGLQFQTAPQITTPLLQEVTTFPRIPGQELTLVSPRRIQRIIPTIQTAIPTIFETPTTTTVIRGRTSLGESLITPTAQLQIPRLRVPTRQIFEFPAITRPTAGLGLGLGFRFGRPSPFGLPGFLPGFSLPSGIGRAPRKRRKLKRQPSFAALFFDIRAPRKAPLEETGLVLRPILR